MVISVPYGGVLYCHYHMYWTTQLCTFEYHFILYLRMVLKIQYHMVLALDWITWIGLIWYENVPEFRYDTIFYWNVNWFFLMVPKFGTIWYWYSQNCLVWSDIVLKCAKVHSMVPYGAKLHKIIPFGNGTEIQYHMVLMFSELFSLVSCGTEMYQIAWYGAI